jgi:hypothetical protein
MGIDVLGAGDDDLETLAMCIRLISYNGALTVWLDADDPMARRDGS